MSVVLEQCYDGVAAITLNRIKTLNALNQELIEAIVTTAQRHDQDDNIGCIVLFGGERAFVAGADIKAMLPKDFVTHVNEEFFLYTINRLADIKTPMIAAVSGYALGGGCELAMACDMIIAADTAIFGQPEITLGTIPGLGGSQRLTRAIGKAKAMDLVLSGRHMDAHEAERCGLVARVVDAAQLHDEAMSAAKTIASYSRPAVRLAKQAVNAAAETTLTQGLRTERHLFEATFALEDRREGMTAFVEKRPAQWRHQ